MRRTLLLALLLLASCSRQPVPVLRVELGAAAGAPSGSDLGRTRGVLARRLESLSAGARLARAGDQFVVELDATGASKWRDARESLLRPGRLDFVAVADNVVIDIVADAARGEGLTATKEQDTWTFESADRAALVPRLSAILAKEIPGETRFVPALLVAEPGANARAQILDRDVEHVHVAVVEAHAGSNEFGAFALARLSRESGRRFEEVTRRLVGHSLAILLDGEIHSAPKVMDAITGGSLQITVGGARPLEQQKRDAEVLAATIGAGELPFDLVVRSETTIAPR